MLDLEKNNAPLLKNMGAVTVNGKLVATEKIATRSFMLFGESSFKKLENQGLFLVK